VRCHICPADIPSSYWCGSFNKEHVPMHRRLTSSPNISIGFLILVMTISFLQLNTCTRCCRTYLTSETLKRHIRYAHSVNRIRCQWCPYEVSRNPIVRIFRIVRRQTNH
jgi:hypothetical protein